MYKHMQNKEKMESNKKMTLRVVKNVLKSKTKKTNKKFRE
jgi:hypothetical protein